MEKTIFNITKMDCPSEEQLIRMKLQDFDTVKGLEFDIANRKLDVYHNGNPEPIFLALGTLNLNTTLVSTEKSNFDLEDKDNILRIDSSPVLNNFLAREIKNMGFDCTEIY